MAKQDHEVPTTHQAAHQTSPQSHTITVTEAELQARIAAAVAVAMGAMHPAEKSLDERVKDAAAKERPRGEPVELVHCISRPEVFGTGAGFVAAVARGRIVNLFYHTKPVGWERSLPDGMMLVDKNGQVPIMTRQHLWTEYWKKDLQLFSGRKLTPALRSLMEMTPEEKAMWGLPNEAPPGAGVGCSAEPEPQEAA